MSDLPLSSDWRDLLAAATPSTSVSARTFVQEWQSYSHPVALACDDGEIYVVKGRQLNNGRVAVNEQIVGRLGMKLGAPVGQVVLVEISAELLAIEPRLQHLPSGLAHGSLHVPDCTDRMLIDHATVPANRSRFARLAFLYGWMHAGDHQLIYSKSENIVYSVDHGHFFPGGPDWTTATIRSAPSARIDPLFDPCALTPDEIAEARAALDAITNAEIAMAIAAPPSSWNFSLDDRVAMADYVARRREDLLAATVA